SGDTAYVGRCVRTKVLTHPHAAARRPDAPGPSEPGNIRRTPVTRRLGALLSSDATPITDRADNLGPPAPATGQRDGDYAPSTPRPCSHRGIGRSRNINGTVTSLVSVGI